MLRPLDFALLRLDIILGNELIFDAASGAKPLAPPEDGSVEVALDLACFLAENAELSPDPLMTAMAETLFEIMLLSGWADAASPAERNAMGRHIVRSRSAPALCAYLASGLMPPLDWARWLSTPLGCAITSEWAEGSMILATSLSAEPTALGWSDRDLFGHAWISLWRHARSFAESLLCHMLAMGWDPDDEIRGLRALHVAARDGSPELIGLLLRAGCDPDAQDATGRTPLHRACEGFGGRAVFDALLQAGADPRSRDHFGITPIDLAASLGNTKAQAAFEPFCLALAERREMLRATAFEHQRVASAVESWLSTGASGIAQSGICREWQELKAALRLELAFERPRCAAL